MANFTLTEGPDIFPGPGDDNSGDDVILGLGGADEISGGGGADTITGGTGNDTLNGDAGADRFIWNNGDGNDEVEGGANNDTQEINAGAAAGTFKLTTLGSRLQVERLSPDPFAISLADVESVVLRAGDGADKIDLDGTALGAGRDVVSFEFHGGGGADDVMLGYAEVTLRLFGGDGADRLIAGSGADVIDGGADDDVIAGGGGADVIDGGDGADTITAPGGFAAINGGDGDDLVRTTNGVTGAIDGGGGMDTLRLLGAATAGTGANIVSVERLVIEYSLTCAPEFLSRFSEIVLTDTTLSSAGTVDFTSTSLFAGNSYAAAYLTGSSGNDQIFWTKLSAVPSIVDGGAGDDAIWAYDSGQTLRGNGGNDVVVAGAGDDALYGDVAIGRDYPAGADGNDMLFGGGFAADGSFLANSGNDFLSGGDGHDALWGGDGDDVLQGDHIYVEHFETVVYIHSGSGDDTLIGGAGNDRLNGGKGNDLLFGGEFGADGSRLANSGDDWMEGHDGADAIYGFDGNDSIDAQAGNDYVEGGEGADRIDGGNDSDTILGGAGDDQLFGGRGFDYLYGGAGADTFGFYRQYSADWILDFKASEGDKLRIVDFGYATFADIPFVDLSTPGNPAVQFTFNGPTGVDQLTIFGVTLAQLNAGNVFVT